jgi:peptidoglycan-N-acetylglucosamine deacetylase
MEEVQRGAPAGDWLAGASVVVVLTFEIDAEATGSDLTALSHEAYGVRVGLPRILQLLTRLGVPGTFFFPGTAAARYPHLLESIAQAGHEIALHGNRRVRLPSLSDGAQRADFEAGLQTLRGLGHEVSGYRAPYWQLTPHTLDLLGHHGFTYDSSLMDDDRPYRMRTRTGVLAELPVHWSLDDREEHPFAAEGGLGKQVESPVRVFEMWTEELEAMRGTRSLAVLSCHPVVTGRPSRLRMLERVVEFARERRDVRFERADRVAQTVLTARPQR